MDERRPEIEQLVRVVRSVEPPVGARARVHAAVLEALPRRRRRKLWLTIVLLPATAVAALGVHHVVKQDPPTAVTDAARPDARRVRRGRAEPAAASRPASTPAPAEPSAPARTLEDAAQPAAAARPRPRRRPRRRVAPRVAPAAPTPAPSALSQEVAAYEQAMRERAQGRPAAALAGLQQMRRRWPHGSLAHEVDLRVIETLLQLGRAEQARAEARRFLARHPRSPKRGSVHKLLVPDGGVR